MRRITLLVLVVMLSFMHCTQSKKTEQKSTQKTYVPDDKFEQILIDLGYDSELDDFVLSENIKEVTRLRVWRDSVKDLTGIEDFVALTELDCSFNQLTRLEV